MTSLDVIRIIAQADLEGADVRYVPEALLSLCDRVEELETQLHAARSALAACREVAAKRAGR